MADDHQYGVSDLRQLLSGRTSFQLNPETLTPYLLPATASEAVWPTGGGFLRFEHETSAAAVTTVPSAGTAATGDPSRWCNIEEGRNSKNNDEDGNSNCRWPREETLTLLEIRSRLDSKFKETNLKKPLWDEVSRIMAEEHGYYRSEKKCREKFENLYKYYKKTKGGKSGRKDGKHYRFFCQLEALCGDKTNHNNNQDSPNQNQNPISSQSQLLLPVNPSFPFQYLNQTPNKNPLSNTLENQENESLSFSNTSELFETPSTSGNNDNYKDDLSAIAFMMKQKSKDIGSKKKQMIDTLNCQNGDTKANSKKRGWKRFVKEVMDSQTKKLIESQEELMEKLLKNIEDREKERFYKEEEWRKQQTARVQREHEFWIKEVARIEARDKALMDTLRTIKGERQSCKDKEIECNVMRSSERWSEDEISRLLEFIRGLETKLQERVFAKEIYWEEIAQKLAGLGYNRNARECKEKWENMEMYLTTPLMESDNKKGKDDMTTKSIYSGYNYQNFLGYEGKNRNYEGNMINQESNC